MHPKSHKEFRNEIAEIAEVHPQVVEDFITFYYAKVRRKLSELSFPRIYVEGLGTFELRKSKLEKAIKKNKSLLGNIAKRTYNGYAKSEDIKINITQMEAALEQIHKDLLEKKSFKNEK
jgi:nucleoid DNA-binding protein